MLSRSCIFSNIAETQVGADQTATNIPHINLMMLDDSIKDITLLDDILSNSNISYNLEGYTDFKNFVNSATSNSVKPDLLVVDVNMPEINGLDVLKKIKNTNSLKNIPIIIHSSSKEHDHWINAKRFKADAFFHKPLNIEQFLDFIISSPLFNK